MNQSIDLEDGPTVVLMQNGIGIEHGLQVAYPQVPVISVVVWIGANLHPGPLVTHGIMEKLIMGLYLGEGGDSPQTQDAVEGELVPLPRLIMLLALTSCSFSSRR